MHYIIAIGGSGMRVLESVVHLAAAGYYDGIDEIGVILVDPDQSNQCVARITKTISRYNDALKTFPDLFQGPEFILKSGEHSWTPVPNTGWKLSDMTIESGDSLSDLYGVLYTQEEMNTTLDDGFLGHPSIGSNVMANALLDIGEQGLWYDLFENLAPDDRIILIGSIFGGAGASGVPTLAKRLYDNRGGERRIPVNLASILMLPYFKFDEPTNVEEKNQLHAEEKYFVLSTKAALRYYHKYSTEQRLYLIGYDPLFYFDWGTKGGPNQDNPPTWLEMVASTGVHHFFTQDNVAPGELIIAEDDEADFSWDDLYPGNIRGEAIQSGLGKLSRFAFAFLHEFYHKMIKIADPGVARNVPWLSEFFGKFDIKELGIVRDRSNVLAKYLEYLLLWCANIQATGNFKREADPEPGENTEISLFSAYTFAQFNDKVVLELRRNQSDDSNYRPFYGGKFISLVKEKPYFSRNLADLDRALSGTNPTEESVTARLKELLSVLYQNCGT